MAATYKSERHGITLEELAQFFEDRGVRGQCPSCGSNQYAPLGNADENGADGVALLVTDNKSRLPDFPGTGAYVPMIGMGCKNCGTPRMFVWAVVEEWKEKRKQKEQAGLNKGTDDA